MGGVLGGLVGITIVVVLAWLFKANFSIQRKKPSRTGVTKTAEGQQHMNEMAENNTSRVIIIKEDPLDSGRLGIQEVEQDHTNEVD